MIRIFRKVEIGNIVDLLESYDKDDRQLGINILKRDVRKPMSKFARVVLYSIVFLTSVYITMKWGNVIFGIEDKWDIFEILLNILIFVVLLIHLLHKWDKD